MKSIAVLLNLLQYFYRWILCDKTRNFVHGEGIEIQHEIYRLMHGVKKKKKKKKKKTHTHTHKIYYKCSTFIKFLQDVTKDIFFDDSKNFCKLLDGKC